MSNIVVQKSYAPIIRPWVEGQVVDETDSAVSTWLCETAAGIGFGKAVGYGTGERGAVLGTGAGFLGITVKDITLDGTPIRFDATVRGSTDMFVQGQNMGVLTRGRIAVIAYDDVAVGDALYYDGTAGTFSSSSSGQKAHGYIDFTANPLADETVTINGQAWTFKTSGASGTQTNIRSTLGDTLKALADDLNASDDSDITPLTYDVFPEVPNYGGSGAYRLLISDDTAGALTKTIATNVTGASASGATLTGGSASATAITGGRWLSKAISGQLAIASLSIQV